MASIAQKLQARIRGVRIDVPLSKYAKIGTGGNVVWLYDAPSREKLEECVKICAEENAPFIVIGAGTNIVPTDGALKKGVIRVAHGTCDVQGDEIMCGAGARLGDLVDTACGAGCAGFEKLAGIPGTVGGALYGNAGAFGQLVSDRVVSVDVWNGKKIVSIPREKCMYGYRDSVFKKKPLVILGARFCCEREDAEALKKTAAETIVLRESRYDKTLKVPGSFFKNVDVKKFSKKVLATLPLDKIQCGRVPVGYLLDEVESRGMSAGGAFVADFHSNWIYNKKRATARDVKALAAKLKKLVKKRFGVELQEEVQYIG